MMVAGRYDVVGVVRGDLVGMDVVEEIVLGQGALGGMRGRRRTGGMASVYILRVNLVLSLVLVLGLVLVVVLEVKVVMISGGEQLIDRIAH